LGFFFLFLTLSTLPRLVFEQFQQEHVEYHSGHSGRTQTPEKLKPQQTTDAVPAIFLYLVEEISPTLTTTFYKSRYPMTGKRQHLDTKL
jgi:hypothetical protein